MQRLKSTQAPSGSGFFKRELHEWFGNPMGDFWGGIVTTFAMIPEVIGFMLVVGVPPYLGLLTCILFPIIMSFVGGCPALVSAAAGGTALAAVPLVSKYWATNPEYLFAATFLAGIILILMGVCRFGNLMKYIPLPVMNGFVNGFATVIFISQVKLCTQVDFSTGAGTASAIEMYILIAVGIGIIYAYPLLQKRVKFLQKVPSSLIAIALITTFGLVTGLGGKNIGSMGSVAVDFGSMGMIFGRLGNVFTMECLLAILPTSFTIAFAAVMETLLTAKLVEEHNHIVSRNNREAIGLGVANMACSALGSVPGCGMIAMAVTNMKSGGRGRLSTLILGVFMGILLFTLGFFMEMIPLAALIAVMFTVCFHTIKWPSIVRIYKSSLKDAILMLLTAGVVIATEDIAYGVAVGMIVYVLLILAEKFLNRKWQAVACFVLFAAAGGCVWIGWGTAVALVLGCTGLALGSILWKNRKTDGLGGAALAAMICNGAMIACAITFIVTGTIWEFLPWFSWNMLKFH